MAPDKSLTIDETASAKAKNQASITRSSGFKSVQDRKSIKRGLSQLVEEDLKQEDSLKVAGVLEVPNDDEDDDDDEGYRKMKQDNALFPEISDKLGSKELIKSVSGG